LAILRASSLPIVNSPPGIQIIPSGAGDDGIVRAAALCPAGDAAGESAGPQPATIDASATTAHTSSLHLIGPVYVQAVGPSVPWLTSALPRSVRDRDNGWVNKELTIFQDLFAIKRFHTRYYARASATLFVVSS
jgi:hypothetical protein